MKRRSGLVLIALLAIGTSLLQSACSDFVETRYSSLPEAERDGAVSRGWLPEALPASSFEIREIHNIDTNEVWCTFRFSTNDANTFRAVLNRVGEGDTLPRVRPPNVTWWPTVLQGSIDKAVAQDAGLELYRKGPMLFAVDWTQGVVYFYQPSS